MDPIPFFYVATLDHLSLNIFVEWMVAIEILISWDYVDSWERKRGFFWVYIIVSASKSECLQVVF